MKKTPLISGIQPSGTLHIGNYLGALKNFVELQNSGKYECYFFIADLHALTELKSAKELEKNTSELMFDFLAAGLDPKKSTLFIQSRIPEHAELSWIFTCLTPMGELERMTQYKDKVGRGIMANVGLFTYPDLMAADILIYKANVIPVGNDQDQHLEFTRTIARTFNKFGTTFPEPNIVLTKTPRVMSLTDPVKKMSKSDPLGCLFLTDSPETTKKKISRAVTDSEKTIGYEPKTRPGLANLIDIYSALSQFTTLKVVNLHKNKGYAEFKSGLAELLIKELAPFQERRRALASQKSSVIKIFETGSLKARAIAQKTIGEVKQKIGLV